MNTLYLYGCTSSISSLTLSEWGYSKYAVSNHICTVLIVLSQFFTSNQPCFDLVLVLYSFIFKYFVLKHFCMEIISSTITHPLKEILCNLIWLKEKHQCLNVNTSVKMVWLFASLIIGLIIKLKCLKATLALRH